MENLEPDLVRTIEKNLNFPILCGYLCAYVPMCAYGWLYAVYLQSKSTDWFLYDKNIGR